MTQVISGPALRPNLMAGLHACELREAAVGACCSTLMSCALSAISLLAVRLRDMSDDVQHAVCVFKLSYAHSWPENFSRLLFVLAAAVRTVTV